jgi:hypothetical protein
MAKKAPALVAPRLNGAESDSEAFAGWFQHFAGAFATGLQPASALHSPFSARGRVHI